jgi:Na+-translocating ferredoxin:NAD+ oxidoreductase RNF subunit RnfB
MIGILILTITALILGIILVLTDLTINKKDIREEEFLKRLPGYNCGSCGFGSCPGMAKEMCKNIECYKKCRPLRGDKLKEMEEYLKSLKK